MGVLSGCLSVVSSGGFTSMAASEGGEGGGVVGGVGGSGMMNGVAPCLFEEVLLEPQKVSLQVWL